MLEKECSNYMKLFLIAIFTLVGNYSLAADLDCSTFQIENATATDFYPASHFINEATSINPLRTTQVTSVSFQEVRSPSKAYILSCESSSGDAKLDQRMRSAIYWATVTMKALSNRVHQYFRFSFSPKPLGIKFFNYLKDSNVGEIIPASGGEHYGAEDNLSGELNIGVYDLPDSKLFPVVLSHELTHMFHRQYLQALGLSGHRSRAFAEALADFFATRTLGISRNSMMVAHSTFNFSFERDLRGFNRFPQDLQTIYEFTKPMSDYFLNIFPEKKFPKKHENIVQGAEWVRTNLSDINDMRAWYWYLTGLVINQTLFRVIDENPACSEEIEKAYLKLIPFVVYEDWDLISLMPVDKANETLKKSFHYAPFFAHRYLEQVEDVKLRARIEQQFKNAIGDM